MPNLAVLLQAMFSEMSLSNRHGAIVPVLAEEVLASHVLRDVALQQRRTFSTAHESAMISLG